MPLVVPALRLFMTFMNVYDTYKTLKVPPGRKGGLPSTRAMTQRKRDLKGCLAVWVVWCCLAAYERTFDRFVSFIVPFYSEIKSVTLLFLLLTRAKGAEPLYLHILRPLIKPYVDTLDPMLDLARDIGDFLFALSQVPLNYVLSLSSGLSWHTEENESATDISGISASGLNATRSSSYSNIPMAAKAYTTVDANPRAADRRPVTIRSVSDNRARPKSRQPSVEYYEGTSLERRVRYSKSSSMTTLPHYPNNTVGRVHARPATSSTRKAAYQIWHPPPSAHEEERRRSRLSVGRSGIANASTPNLMTPPPAVVVSEPPDEDWRGYPAFPSAYPPTPLPTSHSLPGTTPSRQDDCNDSPPAQATVISPILEDTLNHNQDFDVSLQQAHEPTSPSSSSCSSDESSSLPRVHPGVDGFQSSGGVRSQDEDAYTDVDDDDFDVTLRTPYRASPSSVASNASSSAASLHSTLTTNDNASSLRTSNSSESIRSFHTSGSAYYAGQKRSYPTITRSQTNTTIRGKVTAAASYKNDLDSGPGETDDDDEDIDSEDSGVGAKRRKVLEPTRRTTHLRPIAKPTTNVRKPPLTTRNLPASARGKVVAPAQKNRTRGGSRAAPQTAGLASQRTHIARTDPKRHVETAVARRWNLSSRRDRTKQDLMSVV
ncbi:uncharacterized protein EDB91DRAFT_521326 [Suillus paluster]|uniref:uncharacterized protein n=1 Tax=Suillus paluster TaxID=48578 RepID=UPI001B86A85A|nr:uncharacterized protein EDB91DRAFT_521326 [Suillus paluster]KAG1752518.1 hypothetical protein EDB91DRAFT_521326 [Suillus paluster]